MVVKQAKTHGSSQTGLRPFVILRPKSGIRTSLTGKWHGYLSKAAVGCFIFPTPI